ncbi:pyridoxamine 5'-phosphate oxidase family protein [Actinomadura sp. ATCC 31491]|uniref:Pyridoxamine 5'-phosphate oxidase family protein n=1 Tax=Actinomadura luzonensis TaxID=2805427 RepID=A0ABT0FTM9_9ACTN|nr:pyridoxamine 5'-phosphate oxidase family protein [Actinomadura luzonensis]MCK2215689.1 pyridoxamine 5'-phosphate oxidase family protein [Actinomadura luzonensis]
MPYPSTQPPPVSRRLSRPEGLRLLGNVTFGRIVFISRALPGIQLVSHVMDGEDLLVGLPGDCEVVKLLTQLSPVVYEADVLDTATRHGWSIVLTGRAGLVEDDEEIARALRRLRPWPGEEISVVVRIHPELVTGTRIEDATAAAR